MKDSKYLALATVLLATYCVAQDMDLRVIIHGPFGRPALVKDLAGNWTAATEIYSDANAEAFVPDITSRGWIAWNVGEFRREGTYTVYLYSHFARNGFCHQPKPSFVSTWPGDCARVRYMRKLIQVDTRKKTVTLLEIILMTSDDDDGTGIRPNPLNRLVMHTTSQLPDNSPFGKEVAHITSIVGQGVAEYKGLTAQEIMQNNQRVATRNAIQMMTPDHQQGCPNVTAEQRSNWHQTGCPPANIPCTPKGSWVPEGGWLCK